MNMPRDKVPPEATDAGPSTQPGASVSTSDSSPSAEPGDETGSAKKPWLKYLGVGAFWFFLIKGLLWLIVPAVLLWLGLGGDESG